MTRLLTDEQLALRDSARAFLADRYPMSWVRSWTEADASTRGDLHRQLWKDLAELGWLGLPWPEALGGSGLGFVEQAIVLEEMGRSLLPSPYLGTLLAASLLDRSGDESLRRESLAAVCRGERALAVAYAEDGGENPWEFRTRAFRTGSGWHVSGTKLFVPDADLADRLLVVARGEGDGLAWFSVEHGAAGLSIEALATMDATRPLHRVSLGGVAAVRVGDFAPLWAHVEPIQWLALASEAVGGCERVLEDAVAYAKQRVQFGIPIGANQAIKHKCSNMLVRTEGARALGRHAARELAAGRDEARTACSMAKAYATEAYREVAAEGIQIHGGVGFTWEFDCHLFYKRARASEFAAGHPDEHRERIAAEAGL